MYTLYDVSIANFGRGKDKKKRDSRTTIPSKYNNSLGSIMATGDGYKVNPRASNLRWGSLALSGLGVGTTFYGIHKKNKALIGAGLAGSLVGNAGALYAARKARESVGYPY